EKGLPLDPFLAFVVSGWAVRPTLRVLRDGYPPDQASSGHGVSAVHPLDDLDGPIAEAAAQVARLAGALGLDQAGTPRAS
ncbi:MAG: hypothetical protein KC620_26825, partial [Myxococcales bacterium]|nr:hypothetical protein [Myxococcales bacterium]